MTPASWCPKCCSTKLETETRSSGVMVTTCLDCGYRHTQVKAKLDEDDQHPHGYGWGI